MRRFETQQIKDLMAEYKGVEFRIEEDLLRNQVKVIARSKYVDLTASVNIDRQIVSEYSPSAATAIKNVARNLADGLIKWDRPPRYWRDDEPPMTVASGFGRLSDYEKNLGINSKPKVAEKPEVPIESEYVGIF